ncbi:MAG: sensor histidine kinase [Gammaproteobacteria bacterium]|nr:sensor histidine kinase [Gammaproteobacteria bacterium]NNM21615.1 sensor histidine kinase [Gammaproteobacteria bacterium]
MTFAIVLLAELVALVLTLARLPAADVFWIDLARSSMFLLWIGLGNAVVLCGARRFLAGRSAVQTTAVSLFLVMATTALVSEAAWLIGDFYSGRAGGAASAMFPASHLPFLLRNTLIAAIVGALMLRYFYVSHQWRRNVQMEARSRIQALQARIRPHFLFNSMNTIAALTRSDPDAAEQVVEDLADLFRASLADNKQLIHLREEFEMARLYQRIEELRLGDRLTVEWDVDELPDRALIPGLSVQPLLENAIYHGIEPLPGGGKVLISGRTEGDKIHIEIVNPVNNDASAQRHDGNRIALSNVRQRLDLAFGRKGGLKTLTGDGQFSVTLTIPAAEVRR